jgi:hypothetical protein
MAKLSPMMKGTLVGNAPASKGALRLTEEVQSAELRALRVSCHSRFGPYSLHDVLTLQKVFDYLDWDQSDQLTRLSLAQIAAIHPILNKLCTATGAERRGINAHSSLDPGRVAAAPTAALYPGVHLRDINYDLLLAVERFTKSDDFESLRNWKGRAAAPVARRVEAFLVNHIARKLVVADADCEPAGGSKGKILEPPRVKSKREEREESRLLLEHVFQVSVLCAL